MEADTATQREYSTRAQYHHGNAEWYVVVVVVGIACLGIY
jgi:hypothetical protein